MTISIIFRHFGLLNFIQQSKDYAPMFFPHSYDNAKIVGMLFLAFRTKKDWTQEELADKTGVSRVFVSSLENYFSITKALESSSRKISREDVLEFLSKLNIRDWEKRVDILLWLFDGYFLEPRERKKYFGVEEARDTEIPQHRLNPRGVVIELLEKALEIFSNDAKKKKRDPRVKVIPYRNDKDLVGEELFEMENKESIWLIMKQVPFYLTRCLEVKNGKLISCELNSSIDNKRVDNFQRAIATYGAKVIFERSAIEHYADKKNPLFLKHNLTRKRQIAVLIKLMEDSGDRFQVRLAESTTPFEFQLNGLDVVMIRARLRPPEYADHKSGINSYVRYIRLTGGENVLPFILEFETMWDTLKQSNDEVIRQLNQMIK